MAHRNNCSGATVDAAECSLAPGHEIASAELGDGVVAQLAEHLARTQPEPGLQGFTRRNLFRMRQFYEAYADNETAGPPIRQLPWTHHPIILSGSKRPEERKRELERQFKTALFERTVLNPVKVSPLALQTDLLPLAEPTRQPLKGHSASNRLPRASLL